MRYSILTIIFLCIFTANVWAQPHQQILGVVEKVKLVEENVIIHAKLDTGAKTSSLDARDIHLYTKNNEKWVSFILLAPHHEPLPLNYKVIAFSRIKKHSLTSSVRPVIKMKICLGNELKTIKVNLTNREHFLYPMLLGREALGAFAAIVNPLERFTVDPRCA